MIARMRWTSQFDVPTDILEMSLHEVWPHGVLRRSIQCLLNRFARLVLGAADLPNAFEEAFLLSLDYNAFIGRLLLVFEGGWAQYS